MKLRMFRALLTFYRRFFLVTGSISMLFCIFLWSTKSLSYGFTLLWMKVITNLTIGFFYLTFNKGATLFYNNLGYSSLRMYAGVMVLDIFIWLVMISILLLVR
ncbi:MAG: hypothetical protein WAZ98_06550 [Cyclobacteriaceae bacterium]